MCRVLEVALDPVPHSVSSARRAVYDACRAWEIEVLQDDLALLASELVSNALLHARTAVTLHLSAAGEQVELAVGDRAPSLPVMRPSRSDLLGDLDRLPRLPPGRDDRHPDLHVGASGSIAAGRGLHLVAALAERWGVSAQQAGPGKQVWAVLPLPQGWPHRPACCCSTTGRRTPSGGVAHHNPGPWDDAPEPIGG